jgi:serine/threonine protein kinase
MSELDPRQGLSETGVPLPAMPGFTLTERLGRGAVGVTFRATRSVDGRELALKLLHPQVSARPATRPRLDKLAATLPSLEHANIARFEGFGALPGSQVRYGLAELIRGAPLTTHLQSEGVTLRELVDRFAELLSALSEAHRHGVLHLGLRPGNVLVEQLPDGSRRVRLVDLGLGRLLKPDRPGSPYSVSSPQFLRVASPELLAGRDLDGRSDLFAVGALLYEVLTGRPAFPSESADEVIRAITLRDVVPPSSRATVRPVPRELEAVAVRALRRNPDDRFRTALEMGQALRASLELLASRADVPLGPSFSSAPAPPTPVRATLPGEQLPSRTKVWLGLALLGAAGAALVWGRGQEPPPTDEERMTAVRIAMSLGRYSQALELLPEHLALHDPALACTRAEALRGLGREAEAGRWLAAASEQRGTELDCSPPAGAPQLRP